MFEVRHLEVHEHELLLPMLGAMYPSVSDSDLATRLDTIADSAWQCVGAFSSGRLIGMAGYWVNTRFYCGRYLYVDHFYVDPEFRRRNVAARLLETLNDCAAEADCAQVCLDTFVSNAAAQHLWHKAGFSIVGFHFVRSAPGGPAPYRST